MNSTACHVVRDDGVAGSNPATPTSSALTPAQQRAELRLCSPRYRAERKPLVGWCVTADYSAHGGEAVHVCRAVDEFVAIETAAALQDWRSARRIDIKERN